MRFLKLITIMIVLSLSFSLKAFAEELSDSDLLDCSSVTQKWDCIETCGDGEEMYCGGCGVDVGGAIGKKLGKDAKRWADGECRGEDEYSSDFEGPVVLCPKLLWCGVQNAAAKSDLKNLLKYEKERRKEKRNLNKNCKNPVDVTGAGTWLCCDSPEAKKKSYCQN